MLDVITFKNILESTPLVSIDPCFVCGDQLFFGRRTREPLKGELDHFCSKSGLDQNTSTHYMNLSKYEEFKSKPPIDLDDQYSEFMWFDLSVVSNDKKFHPYMRNFSIWLLKKMDNSYD